jgi:hypothetical protein
VEGEESVINLDVKESFLFTTGISVFKTYTIPRTKEEEELNYSELKAVIISNTLSA